MCLILALLINPKGPIIVYANDGQPETQITESKYQDDIDLINDKIENLNAEMAAIQNNINAAQTQREKDIASKQAVDQRISIAQNELGLLLERLSLLEQALFEKQAHIDQAQADIMQKQIEHDEHYGKYLDRLGAMQLMDEGTMLSVLLGADSYSDFLSTNEMMRRIAEYDRNLIRQIQEERKALETDRLTLEAEYGELEATRQIVDLERADIESKRKNLAAEQHDLSQKIQDMDEMERQFKADLAENQKLQKQMQAELDRIFQQIEWDQNPYVGGNMLWPVPGYYDISSYYGMRFQNTDFHTGVDIFGTGIHGQNVVAANDGTVRTTNWTYVPGKNYGIYVIIDHGGNTATLYAHLSNISVNVGDIVKKGGVIGNVGNTGWSTGPHLHFEVRIDKKHTNPLPYLQGEK